MLEGAALVEPSFTIVLHGLRKHDVNFERDTAEQLESKIDVPPELVRMQVH